MTCIVAIETKEGVYMGGDRAASSETSLEVTSNPKIFYKDDQTFVYGYAGSFRQGQVLEYMFEEPEDEEGEVMSYMVRQYIPEIRKCFEKQGVLQTDLTNNEESIDAFIVGYKGYLFYVDGDLQVNRYECKYLSLGLGCEYALGSLFTTKSYSNTKNRILMALKAATKHCPGVSEPFDLLFLPVWSYEDDEG